MATWVGSIFVGLSFAFLAYGTIKQAGEMRRQAYLDESAQARLISGIYYFAVEDEDNGVLLAGLKLHNASELPVRNVTGYILSEDAKRLLARFDKVPVLLAGELDIQTRITLKPEDMKVQNLVLAFNDDAGARWRKYDGKNRVTLMGGGKDDLHGLISRPRR